MPKKLCLAIFFTFTIPLFIPTRTLSYYLRRAKKMLFQNKNQLEYKRAFRSILSSVGCSTTHSLSWYSYCFVNFILIFPQSFFTTHFSYQLANFKSNQQNSPQSGRKGTFNPRKPSWEQKWTRKSTQYMMVLMAQWALIFIRKNIKYFRWFILIKYDFIPTPTINRRFN